MEGTEMNERIQTEWTLRMLGILRIVAGFLFIAHGTQKLFNYPAGSGAVELFSLMGFAGCLSLSAGLC
jgi:putative oxidoreductase